MFPDICQTPDSYFLWLKVNQPLLDWQWLGRKPYKQDSLKIIKNPVMKGLFRTWCGHNKFRMNASSEMFVVRFMSWNWLKIEDYCSEFMVFEPCSLKINRHVWNPMCLWYTCVYCWLADWHNPHSDTNPSVCCHLFFPAETVNHNSRCTLITDSDQAVMLGCSHRLFKVFPVFSGALRSSVFW